MDSAVATCIVDVLKKNHIHMVFSPTGEIHGSLSGRHLLFPQQSL
jgi:hypothetical protein